MDAKYKKLAEELKKQILDQQKTGLYKLPSEKAIGEYYRVSRQTVRGALRLLQTEGLIEKRKGSGSYATGLSPVSSENRVALLLRAPEEYLYPSLISDISTRLKERGYTLQVYATDGHFDTERRLLLSLLSGPLHGLIAEPCHTAMPSPNLDLYEQLRSCGTSVLFLGAFHGAPPGSVFLKSGDYKGGYEAARYLLSKNHTRIGGIFQADQLSGLERCHGFFAAMRDFQMPLPDEQILLFTQTDLAALESRRDTGFLTLFIRRQLKDCTAVICQNDEIAYWLAKELTLAGFQIPDDINLLSFDNSYLSDMGPVRISSLSLPSHEPGNTAASMLLQMMQGASVHSKELPFTLSAKGSSSGIPGASAPGSF